MIAPMDFSFTAFVDEFTKIAEPKEQEAAHQDLATGGRALAVGAGGIGTSLAGGGLMVQSMRGAAGTPGDLELKKKLTDMARNEGIGVINTPFLQNDAMMVDMRDLKDKSVLDLSGLPELTEEHKKLLKSDGYKSLDKPISRIFLGRGTTGGTLAHELGHARNYDKKTLEVLQGKPYQLGSNSALHAGVGALTGMIGKDYGGDSAVAQHASWAAPLALSMPMLISEGAATVRGRRALGQAGASKAQLRRYWKETLPMFGTYVGRAMFNSGLGLGGRLGGRQLRRLYEEPQEEPQE